MSPRNVDLKILAPFTLFLSTLFCLLTTLVPIHEEHSQDALTYSRVKNGFV
jgi:hypothetical protein